MEAIAVSIVGWLLQKLENFSEATLNIFCVSKCCNGEPERVEEKVFQSKVRINRKEGISGHGFGQRVRSRNRITRRASL